MSLNSLPGLWGALLMNDLTYMGLTKCWIFFLFVFISAWFRFLFNAKILNSYCSSKKKRRWIWRSIHINLLLVVCGNVKSSECDTHWDRTVLFIMDKIALFHFNNLLVVKLVMGFLTHSRKPAIVICISMSRHLSAVAITQHCPFPNLGTVWWGWDVKCTCLFQTDTHTQSINSSCWDSYTTKLLCMWRGCEG